MTYVQRRDISSVPAARDVKFQNIIAVYAGAISIFFSNNGFMPWWCLIVLPPVVVIDMILSYGFFAYIFMVSFLFMETAQTILGHMLRFIYCKLFSRTPKIGRSVRRTLGNMSYWLVYAVTWYYLGAFVPIMVAFLIFLGKISWLSLFLRY